MTNLILAKSVAEKDSYYYVFGAYRTRKRATLTTAAGNEIIVLNSSITSAQAGQVVLDTALNLNIGDEFYPTTSESYEVSYAEAGYINVNTVGITGGFVKTATQVLPIASTVALTTSGVITGFTPTLGSAQTTDMAGTNIAATGGSGQGAQFTVKSSSVTTYVPANATLKVGGTGFTAADTLTIANVGTVKVSTVDANGVILTFVFTPTTTSSTTNPAGTGLAATGGTGTGATFDVTSTATTEYTPTAITMTSAGYDYKENEVLTVGKGGTATVTSIKSSAYGTQINVTGTLSPVPAQNDTFEVLTLGTSPTAVCAEASTGKEVTITTTGVTVGESLLAVKQSTIVTVESESTTTTPVTLFLGSYSPEALAAGDAIVGQGVGGVNVQTSSSYVEGVGTILHFE